MVASFFYVLDGTGKAFVLNVILSYIRKNDQIAIATAVSSITSILLCKGTTAHSQFCFPIPPQHISTCQGPLQGNRAHTISLAILLMFDEISMFHKYDLMALDSYLCQLMNQPTLIFGGKLLLVRQW